MQTRNSMINFQTLVMTSKLYRLSSEVPRLSFRNYCQVIVTAISNRLVCKGNPRSFVFVEGKS